MNSLSLHELYAALRDELSPPWQGPEPAEGEVEAPHVTQGYQGGPNLDNLRMLLQSGADANNPQAQLCGIDKQTPLHAMAGAGFVDAARILLVEGKAQVIDTWLSVSRMQCSHGCH